MLIDTVGLIRRLPHHLIEAFHSTLEEAVSADLILHVCDAASEDAASQAEVTEKLLAELGCGDIPVLQVLNKCDLVPQIQSLFPNEDSVFISAKPDLDLTRCCKNYAEAAQPRPASIFAASLSGGQPVKSNKEKRTGPGRRIYRPRHPGRVYGLPGTFHIGERLYPIDHTQS